MQKRSGVGNGNRPLLVARKVRKDHRKHVPAIDYSLSVVLPAYNEEGVIETILLDVLSKLNSWGIDFEIIVVNDGSRDQTAEIVSRVAATHPQVRLVNHPVNRGYGATLVTGFATASRDLTFFMDSDGQFTIDELYDFFSYMDSYDAVIGYRIERQDTWMRKLNAWGWKTLVGLVLGVHVRDIDCAFKLLRTEFLRQHPLETRGAMINAELLYKLQHAGCRWNEVGVQHLPRLAGKATGAKLSVILRAFRELFTYARKWQQEASI
jgi:glycosyltransferase involved in cell wall biosynthesis